MIRQHPDLFEATVLTAGTNVKLLIDQAREFRPDAVVIADESQYDTLRDALADLPVKVYAGSEALCQVVEGDSIDIVLTAMVGFAGLRPTVAAIKAKKAWHWPIRKRSWWLAALYANSAPTTRWVFCPLTVSIPPSSNV